MCEKPRQCYDESSWFVLDQEQPLGVDAYNMARKEHAFLLMCEGLKQAEVARRLGVSSTAVRQMLDKFAGKMHHVLKHCRCRIERAA
ncbi:MAG: hypothetical protein EHM78_01990 [Myxococcaceae bacterium]|nr:MAG: hypothetical protein EHM78_01990 [Myxococcaceae bacterium]